MVRRVKAFLRRLRSATNHSETLEVVLSQVNPKAPLYDRLTSVVDLGQWVRYRSSLLDLDRSENSSRPHVRLRFLLSVLDRNPKLQRDVALVLQSVFEGVRHTELLVSTGLPDESSFWAEFSKRVTAKFMPNRPLVDGGEQLMATLFPEPEDADWVSTLPLDITLRLIHLIELSPPNAASASWSLSLRQDVEEAMIILGSHVRSIGLSYPIRRRLAGRRAWDLPFEQIPARIDDYLTALRAEQRTSISGGPSREEVAKSLRQSLTACRDAFSEVHEHLGQYGVSLKVVYLLQAANAKITRMANLVDLIEAQETRPERLVEFVSALIEGVHERASVWKLFRHNTQLIAQKIVDRSAEVGEKYIAQSWREFRQMFGRALGGGVYMSLTVLAKAGIAALHLPFFVQGLAFSINYSVAFIGIQLSGFTLATKQPAMTGPALASKLSLVNQGEPVGVLVDEVVKLVRTQAVGIFGNLLVVFPFVLVLDFLFTLANGQHVLVSEAKAIKYLNDFSLLGLSPIYAAITGVLLWVSSLVAGYVDNWFFLNRMGETLKLNRRFNFVVGSRWARSIANFLELNISGLSANLFLAFALGVLPELGKFLGLGGVIDVRHVTLAAGNFMLGVGYFGLSALYRPEFWLGLFGVIVIGVVNVGVSFYLAFSVALRARNLRAERNREIVREIWARFYRHPLSFLFPGRE